MVSNYFIAKEFRKRQKLMMGKKDICMKTTTETLENIKILKLYNWENEFKNRIYNKREEELIELKSALYVNIANIVLFWMCPILVAIATISLYQYFLMALKFH